MDGAICMGRYCVCVLCVYNICAYWILCTELHNNMFLVSVCAVLLYTLVYSTNSVVEMSCVYVVMYGRAVQYDVLYRDGRM